MFHRLVEVWMEGVKKEGPVDKAQSATETAQMPSEDTS